MTPPWWQQPYRGQAPPVGPPLPRPLYPPDAIGYDPSARGGDIVAIKRTVSRLGRWPWQEFDDYYSSEFAHGTPGHDVENSGVAGVQWQQGLETSGYLGKQTYEALRYALVPEGRPHTGEHAMDAVAVSLLEEAYALYHASSKPVREQALYAAEGWIGYKESPPGSNATEFGEWYGMNGQPWCAMFLAYVFDHVAAGSPSFKRGERYAYCPYVVDDALAGRNGLSDTNSPIPGDLVVYDWDGGLFDHIGLFQDGDASAWSAIEGNTSTSSNSNGGEVMRRSRRSSDAANVLFVRVDEP